jgi:hypothetical protein
MNSAVPQQLMKPESGGGLLLLRRITPLTRHHTVYFCSGAYKLPEMFFSAISQKPLASSLTAFLSIYENYVDGASYAWAHAETIANRMNFVFKTRTVPAETRALALDLAIRAAYHMNRFAAMDSCKAMVKTISEEDLALNVVPIIFKQEAAFLSDIEPTDCSNETIRSAIRTIRNKQQ